MQRPKSPKHLKRTAAFIRLARKDLGITQREFADLLKVARVNICKWENADTMPPGWVILMCMDLLSEKSFSRIVLLST